MAKGYDVIADSALVLGTFFYYDVASEKCGALLDAVSDGSMAAAWDFGQPAAGEALAQMAHELQTQDMQTLHEVYNRLFVGPYRLPAPPWASVYIDPESVLFGNITLDYRDWLRANGVKVHTEEYEPEDHIGLMLLMVSWAVRNGVSDEALDEFFNKFFLSWTSRFLELFIAGAESDYYEALGRLAQATFDDWQQRFELEPVKMHMFR